MKIHLTAIIKAKEEHPEEIASVLQDMVRQTREEEACELYSLHQGLEAHNEQPYIKAFGKIAAEKLQEQPTIILTTLI